MRAELDEWFAQPGQWMRPAELWGWHAVPLADCQRIVTTHSAGGCDNEDIIYLDAD